MEASTVAGRRQRPVQHQIGDAAAFAVASVWVGTGAAVEHVQKDYGEDLLVQPSIDGRLSPARIWVQVKGTANGLTAPRSLRVRNSQLLRWSRATDLVVIVSWNTKISSGWYHTVSPAGSLADLMADSQGTSIVEFKEEDIFDVRHAEMLVREAALAHADNELLLRQAWRQQHHNGDTVETDVAVGAIVLSAMLAIGIVCEVPGTAGAHRLNRDFTDEIADRFAAMNTDCATADNEADAVAEAMLTATVTTVLRFALAPVRSHLLDMMSRAALAMLRPSEGWPMKVPWD
jgi:hypothetical protein